MRFKSIYFVTNDAIYEKYCELRNKTGVMSAICSIVNEYTAHRHLADLEGFAMTAL